MVTAIRQWLKSLSTAQRIGSAAVLIGIAVSTATMIWTAATAETTPDLSTPATLQETAVQEDAEWYHLDDPEMQQRWLGVQDHIKMQLNMLQNEDEDHIAPEWDILVAENGSFLKCDQDLHQWLDNQNVLHLLLERDGAEDLDLELFLMEGNHLVQQLHVQEDENPVCVGDQLYEEFYQQVQNMQQKMQDYQNQLGDLTQEMDLSEFQPFWDADLDDVHTWPQYMQDLLAYHQTDAVQKYDLSDLVWKRVEQDQTLSFQLKAAMQLLYQNEQQIPLYNHEWLERMADQAVHQRFQQIMRVEHPDLLQ